MSADMRRRIELAEDGSLGLPTVFETGNAMVTDTQTPRTPSTIWRNSWSALTSPISSGDARATLKRNVLDSIACALGALDGELIPAIRAHAEQFSGRPTATFVGGGRASVDQAAFFNAVLVRYPDLLDTYLTPGRSVPSGGQLRCGVRGRRTRRGARSGFPAGSRDRL